MGFLGSRGSLDFYGSIFEIGSGFDYRTGSDSYSS